MRNSEKAFGVGFIVFWVLALIANLAFWGVIVWAIIKLVNHFAG